MLTSGRYCFVVAIVWASLVPPAHCVGQTEIWAEMFSEADADLRSGNDEGAQSMSVSLMNQMMAELSPGQLLMSSVPDETTWASYIGEAHPDVRRDAGVKPPKVRRRPRIAYPRGASTLGVGGRLIVRVTIDPSDEIESPAVVQPSPAPTLTLAALEGLRKWRFSPAELDGRPVETCYKPTVNLRSRSRRRRTPWPAGGSVKSVPRKGIEEG